MKSWDIGQKEEKFLLRRRLLLLNNLKIKDISPLNLV